MFCKAEAKTLGTEQNEPAVIKQSCAMKEEADGQSELGLKNGRQHLNFCKRNHASRRKIGKKETLLSHRKSQLNRGPQNNQPKKQVHNSA
uniref:Uncharacterized protein n=1 Tax=Salix viminalis TaxID=40686 RepID=A0A6N2KPD5_SALVM